MFKILKIALISTLIIFIHSEEKQKQDDTSTHYHPDPNLANIKGLEYYDDYTQPEDNFWISDKFKQLSEKLGWGDKKQELNLADIKSFLYHLAGYEEGDESKIPQGIKDIYDTYLKSFVGDKFNITELKDKLNVTTLFSAIKDYYDKANQPTYYEQVTQMFKQSWGNISDMFAHMFKTQEEESFFTEQFNNLLVKLGLKEQESILKKDFKKLLHKLFIKDKDTKAAYPKSVGEIFDRFLENIPDQINLKDIKQYLDYNKFIQNIKQVAEKHYGKDYMNKFEDVLNSKNVTEILSKIFNFTMSHEEL
jgi:hypothetical protein